VTLLEDIQSSAVDANSDLATLLRKCKLLAARLGSQPLQDWVLWESNGYPDAVEVPDYRVWSLEVKGHFSGPFGSGIRNAPIPTACLPKSARESYTRYKCRQSIASVEAILSSTTEGTVHVSTGDLALSLGAKVYRGQNCVQAWAEFGTGNLVELANAVRNRILDLTLAVWKEAPGAGELDSGAQPAIEATRVTQIFNTTVYGGSAQVVGTVNASSVEFSIGTNDLVALKQVLAGNGIPEADLCELESALKAEPEAPTAQNFGPRVSAWVAARLGDAAKGTWSIGLGAAGNLLATAIAKYYGLGP